MRATGRGFTLIELMLIVTIVGVLVAIALPTYNEYTLRARVAEALTLADGARVSVGEAYAARGAFPNSNVEAGLPAATSISGDSVASVEIDPGGVIAVTLSSTMGGTPSMDGQTLLLTPTASDGSVTWVCDIGGDTTRYKYVPSECRR